MPAASLVGGSGRRVSQLLVARPVVGCALPLQADGGRAARFGAVRRGADKAEGKRRRELYAAYAGALTTFQSRPLSELTLFSVRQPPRK